MRSASRRTVALLASLALVLPASVGAAAAPSERECTLLIWCKTPEAPKPTTGPIAPKVPGPSAPEKPDDPGGSGGSDTPSTPDDPEAPEPSGPGLGTPTESPSEEPTETPSEEPTDPVEAEKDDGAPIFTNTPAAMGSESLSFTGLKGLAIVDVPTVEGETVRTLKISADSITISGFSLTVRPHDEPGLVTKADTMSLKGNVDVYLGSITATTKDGDSITLGTDTPPPLDDVEPGLVRVTMGLVGTTADSITYDNTDQKIVED